LTSIVNRLAPFNLPLQVKFYTSSFSSKCTSLISFGIDGNCTAGAILLAVTNVPEDLMWSETYNTLFGRTNSPYDSRRTGRGSSGGEGALIASAGSIFGIGSDVGGSIRIPAMFNGVFGFMLSRGRTKTPKKLYIL
jgi:hypothetical protein